MTANLISQACPAVARRLPSARSPTTYASQRRAATVRGKRPRRLSAVIEVQEKPELRLQPKPACGVTTGPGLPVRNRRNQSPHAKLAASAACRAITHGVATCGPQWGSRPEPTSLAGPRSEEQT